MISFHNRLPEWAEEMLNSNEDFKKLALRFYSENTPTAELSKLRVGFLLKDIFDHFTAKLNSKLIPDVSLRMYFAHDFTIASILNSLGMFEVY